MLPRPYLLALLLLLMPIAIIADGLAMAPLAVLLFVLLAWPQRGVLRAMRPADLHGISIILLLAVWPILTSLWSILPHVSLATALRSAVLILLVPLGVYLSHWQDNKDRTVWALLALGIVVASLIILSSRLPQEGLIGVAATLLKRDVSDFLSRDINRGLCALAVLVWPAIIGLACAKKCIPAMFLPWILLSALFCLHSLSAKTGLVAGMITYYGMMLCPRVTRLAVLWLTPLAFLAWPLIFHLLEPTLRGPLWDSLPASSRHRVEIWHFALEKWQERPWLGWGVDSSRAIPGGLEEISPGLVKLPLHPHNLSLNVLLEEGLIGFALFFTALWLLARRVLPGRTNSSMIAGAKAGALVSYLTIGMSGFGMWQGWWEATGVTTFLIAAFSEEKELKMKTPASFKGSGGVGS